MILFSLLLTLVVSNDHPAYDTKPLRTATASAVNKTVLLEAVNAIRKKGCQCGDTWYPAAPPVTWNDLLEKAALNHSADMAQHNYFSHTSRNGDKAGQRIDAAGYRWRTYAENIAVGHDSEIEVVAGWVKSPGHCKNIMNGSYKEMGVAKVGKYWTQTFGAR